VTAVPGGPSVPSAEGVRCIEGISEAEARVRLRAADKARTAYVRRLYAPTRPCTTW